MMNYIKSEGYRILYTGILFRIAGVFAGAALLLNVVNDLFDTQYATTSFSYSCLVANPMVFPYAGIVIAGFLYNDGKKNGNLKNTIAGGTSRVKILIGKFAVSMAAATAVMALTLLVWIASAELLLEKTGPVGLATLLAEIPAVYLLAAVAVISALVFDEMISKTLTAQLLLLGFWIALPKIFLLLGMRYDMFRRVALWIPANRFAMINGMHVNMSECMTAWDTPIGMLQCVVPGALGVLAFLAAGILYVKKRDL